jgi:hypothetical protein
VIKYLGKHSKEEEFIFAHSFRDFSPWKRKRKVHCFGPEARQHIMAESA